MENGSRKSISVETEEGGSIVQQFLEGVSVSAEMPGMWKRTRYGRLRVLRAMCEDSRPSPGALVQAVRKEIEVGGRGILQRVPEHKTFFSAKQSGRGLQRSSQAGYVRLQIRKRPVDRRLLCQKARRRAPGMDPAASPRPDRSSADVSEEREGKGLQSGRNFGNEIGKVDPALL